MTKPNRVIVIGLDGLEPTIVESLIRAGDLPNLTQLSRAGGYSRIATTCPAQTPVAWSTFATGTNPGGHGIFDFIRRDPRDVSSGFLTEPIRTEERVRAAQGGQSQARHAGLVRCCRLPASNRSSCAARARIPPMRSAAGCSRAWACPTSGAALAPARSIRPAGRSRRVKANRPIQIDDRQRRPHRDVRHRPSSSRRPATMYAPRSAGHTIRAGCPCASLRTANLATLDVRRGRVERLAEDQIQARVSAGRSRDGPVPPDPARAAPGTLCLAGELRSRRADVSRSASRRSMRGSWPSKVGTFYTTGMVEDHGALSNGRISRGRPIWISATASCASASA